MTALGPHDQWLLSVFGAHVQQAFDHTAYHVGSSLTEKARYRDVDVRLILPDDEFARYFGDAFAVGWAGGPRLNVWNFAWTLVGRHLTRLPIDFQFQPQTIANQEDGPRSALIVLSSQLAVVRDTNEPKEKP